MKLLAFLLPVAAALSAQSKERFAAYTETHPEWTHTEPHTADFPSAAVAAYRAAHADRIAEASKVDHASSRFNATHVEEARREEGRHGEEEPRRADAAPAAASAWASWTTKAAEWAQPAQAERTREWAQPAQAERTREWAQTGLGAPHAWGGPRASPTAQAEHRSPFGGGAEHRSPFGGGRALGRASPTAGRPSWTASLPESEHHSHLDAVAKMAQYKAAHPERFERFGRADAEAPAPAAEASTTAEATTAAALHNFSHTHTHNYSYTHMHNYSAAELIVFSAGMAHAKAVEGYKAAHPAEFTPAAVAAYKAAHPDRIAEASKLEAYTGADLDVFRAGFEHYDTVVAPYVAEHTEAFSGHKVAEYIFQHPTRFSFPLHG